MLELKEEGFSSSIILSPLCLLLTLHSLKDPEIFPLDHLILVAKSENGKLLLLQNLSFSLYVRGVPAFHYNLRLNNSFVVHC